MKKEAYIYVDYPSSLYPYIGEAEVLIEYQTEEYEDGETYNDILGIFVSETVPTRLIDFCKERAKDIFYYGKEKY